MTQFKQQSQNQPQAPSKTASVAPAVQRSGVPLVATAPTQEDISQRAYDIYAESGYQQGQSAQNWARAEKDLSARGSVACQAEHRQKNAFAPDSPQSR